MRLTLLYGGLFLLSGAALMAIAYGLLVNAGFVFTLGNGAGTQPLTQRPVTSALGGPSASFPGRGSTTHASAQTMAHWRAVALCMREHGVSRFPDPTTSFPSNPAGRYGVVADRDGAILAIPATVNRQSPTFTQATTSCGFMPDYTKLTAADSRRRTSTRQQLLVQSGIALAGMSLLSLVLGWLVAGRVLQPLEDSYHAQRQFVANASHELRAPLTRMRALSEVALANPDANAASLRQAHERVLASEHHLEQLIDGLLALTRGQAGLERRETLDLATLTSEAIRAHHAQLTGLELEIHPTLDTAPALGDSRLLERLIANLIDNAIRYNAPGGHVSITTGTRDRHAFVAIANSGPAVPPEQIERLFRPFQRLDGTRTGHSHSHGHGLGLSIVRAVADAHGAELDAGARPEGGLAIEVSFPSTNTATAKVVAPPPPARGDLRHDPAIDRDGDLACVDQLRTKAGTAARAKPRPSPSRRVRASRLQHDKTEAAAVRLQHCEPPASSA